MTAGRSPLTAVSKTENKTEKEMNTIILMWNPAISSISYREYKNFFRCPVGTDFNWSVWDHDKAHAGDRFFMVRVGEEGKGGKGNGIVMSGHLTSEPYRGVDWSGKGREVYYMDLQPDYLFDPEKAPTPFTDEFLIRTFPGFDWTGGHSGRALDAETASSLETYWVNFILSNQILLANGKFWRIARDVFRKFPVVELSRTHYCGEIRGVDADFYGGWLDVYSFSHPCYYEDDEFLPEPPEDEDGTAVENYRISLGSLRRAFGVKDNRAAAVILRRDYSGPARMARLLDFARKAGCNITESFILVD